jgi:YihY family inner membrane protein
VRSLLSRFDAWQQRHNRVAFAVAVVKKFSDDRGGRLAALIAHYGFLSIFPALLAFVTGLGFLLDSHPALRADIADSAFTQIPILGQSIGEAVREPLTGSTIALIIGLAGAVWAGLGAMQAAQDAMNEVWDVPRKDYPSYVSKRLRSLVMLALVAVLVTSSTVLSQLTRFIAPGVVGNAALVPLAVAFNVGAFVVTFRVLTVSRPAWRQLIWGAVTAGCAYTGLQQLGGAYVERTLRIAQQSYGTFAFVIGLLSWIFIVAQVTVLAAEVNVVLARRLWPRSVLGEPATRSDRESLAAQAHEQTMAPTMSVDVSFGGDIRHSGEEGVPRHNR